MRILATIVAVLFLQNIFSQKNYVEGLIINMKGDTIHGYIDYRAWDKNPDKINFKENLKSENLVFKPLEIKSFTVQDEIYESAVIEIELSSDKTDELSVEKEPIIGIDTVFLQALVKGSKNLSYYKNKSGKEQFYIYQDSSFKLLIYKKYLKEVGGKTILSENKKYLGQLAIYLQDYPKIQSELKNIDYRKNDIGNLIISYNKSKNANIEYQKKKDNVNSQFGILAGLSLNSLSFSGNDSFNYLINADYEGSQNFTAGLNFEIFFPKKQGRLSINNEVIYTSYKINGSYVEEFSNENKYIISYLTFGNSVIKMNNMIRYRFPVKKIFLFFNGGISTGITFNELNYRKQVSKYNGPENITETEALDDTKNYEMGLQLGLGAQYKRISFDLRVEKSTGLSKYTNLNSIINRCYFLLGYKF